MQECGADLQMNRTKLHERWRFANPTVRGNPLNVLLQGNPEASFRGLNTNGQGVTILTAATQKLIRR